MPANIDQKSQGIVTRAYESTVNYFKSTEDKKTATILALAAIACVGVAFMHLSAFGNAAGYAGIGTISLLGIGLVNTSGDKNIFKKNELTEEQKLRHEQIENVAFIATKLKSKE